MDNFNNNGVPEDVTPNTAPASILDGDEATDERPAMPGEPPVESGFKLVQDEPQKPQMGGMNQQPYGQPQMGGMNQQPQFGQPQMGGMNQQPYGQPMGGANYQPYGQPMGGGKPPKVKKPLSKGAIAGIIGGGIALVALIVCAIIFIPKLFRTDKEVIVDAFEATFGVEVEAEVEDTIGAQEIADKFATTGGVREYSMELTEDSMGESVNMNMVESIDVANKLANSTVTVGMNGNNIVNANLVVDETNTYLQLPDMINGYFSLPSDNILQAFENSALGQSSGMEGMPELNLSDMYFNLATSNTATEINGEYVAIAEKLWDSITYEKQGKAKISVNGETVTAKEYFITVPQDAMKDAIGEIWDAAIAEIVANPAALAEFGMDASTFEASMGSYSGMLKSLIQGDLVIKVYIKDDKIVKILCADEISLLGTPIAYDMLLDVDDKQMTGVFDLSVMDESIGVKFTVNDLDTNPAGLITVYAPGETIDVNFKVTDNSAGSKDAFDVYFDVVYGGTTYVSGDVIINADRETNAFDGNLTLDIKDAGELKVDYAGGIKDVTKGVAYTVDLSKCDILADGEKLMGLTAKIKLDTSTHEASGIDTSLPVYDLTTLTESELEDVLTENEALLQSWMEANEELFGSYEEPDVATEPDEPDEPAEPEESDMILEAGGKQVEILGTIDGFALDSVNDWYISYSTEEWSYVEYSLNEGFTPEECIESIYVPEEGVIEQEMNQTIDVDGETIYYSYAKYDDFGYPFSSYVFAKDLGDGVVLITYVGIYDEDEPVQYTKEMLAQTLSSKYYSVK